MKCPCLAVSTWIALASAPFQGVKINAFAFAPPSLHNAYKRDRTSATLLKSGDNANEESLPTSTMDADRFIQIDFETAAQGIYDHVVVLTKDGYSSKSTRVLGPKDVLIYDTSLRGELFLYTCNMLNSIHICH